MSDHCITNPVRSPATLASLWPGFLLAAALPFSPGLAAADNAAAADAGEAIVTEPLERVDTAHEKVSGAVEFMARGVDRFFADERDFEEANETYVQVRMDIINEDGSTSFDSSLRAKVQLPGSERRLRLVLESDPLELDPDAPQDNPGDAVDEPSDYIIGVEGERLVGDWQILPSVGVKVDWPPDPYARLRAIRYFPAGDWVGRVSGTAAWFSSDGVDLDGRVDFDRKLGENNLFRSATAVGWEAEDSYSDASQVFSLYQKTASRTRLAYDIGLKADKDPDWETTEYFGQLRYRRQFYKTWAFVELIPRISWADDNDFDEELSLLVRLELNFGRSFR
jgi:hypothetical protein